MNTVHGKNKYGEYSVPLSSSKTSPPARQILAGQVYEPQTIDFIRTYCKGKDVVHAGTYFGDFIPALAQVCNTLWAMEPKKEHYDCAAETVKLNNIKNVNLFHCGLSDKPDVLKLQTIASDDKRTWGGGSRIVDFPDEVYEEVEVKLIDDIVPQTAEISIIHLDVEGFEERALKGAENTIMRCRPILILETVPSNELVSKFNYAKLGTVHYNTILKPL